MCGAAAQPSNQAPVRALPILHGPHAFCRRRFVWKSPSRGQNASMEANSVPRTPAVSLPRSRRLLTPLSDERLVEQVRRGNDSAFEAIYDRHHRGILGLCRHMLASVEEAEDAVQHTFIQAYDSIRRSDRELKLKAWLYAIARNRCLSVLRARREQAAELHDVPTVGLSEEVQQRSDLRDLLADIRDLPVDQRAAL